MDDLVRFGVIGAGAMGSVHAANLARRVPGSRLVAVADIDRERAEACAAENEAEAAYTSETDMLGHAGLDAVVVCTPPDFHAGTIQAASEAGKHVFCEKPLERTLEQADVALAAVEKAGVKLFIGLNRRYDPDYLALRDAVRAGRVGRPIAIHLVARDPVEALGDSPRPPGDLFLSTTIHELDFAGEVVGSPVESVYVAGGVMAEGGGPVIDDPDTAITLLSFEGGAGGTIDNCRVAAHGYDQRIEVLGTRGMITADNKRTDTTAVSDSTGEHRAGVPYFFGERYGQSYIAEVRAFADCIRSDEPSPLGPEVARQSQVLAIAAWESYRERRRVAVSEIG